MELTVEKENNKLIFKIDGSLDIYTSLDLKVALEEQLQERVSDVIIDMEKLTYIDSSGIGILIKSLNFVQGLKGRFYIANMKPVIEKVFKVSGLTTYFEILSQEDLTKLIAS